MPLAENSPIRIAVVDDNKMILTVFHSLMKQGSFKAEFFSDAAKALSVIYEHPDRYQLLITDIQMPGMDGVDLARKIRQVLPNFPIIFMTAEPTEQAQAAARELGRIVFLEKPFPLESTLKEFIPKFLRGEIQ